METAQEIMSKEAEDQFYEAVSDKLTVIYEEWDKFKEEFTKMGDSPENAFGNFVLKRMAVIETVLDTLIKMSHEDTVDN